MKILVIGFSYLSPINLDKWRAYSALYPGDDITVVVPHEWKEVFGKMLSGKPVRDGNLEVVPVKAHLNTSETGHFYAGALRHLFKKLQPDIAFVEHGVYSVSLMQAAWLVRRFSPHTKLGFFTWWNLPYRLNPALYAIEKINMASTAFGIVGNQDAKKILVERGYAKPLTVLPLLGADESLYRRTPQPELAAALGLTPERGVLLLFAGRLVPEKGVMTLLRAAQRLTQDLILRKWKLVMVGGGKLDAQIRAFIEEHALQSAVILHPPTDHYGIIKYLSLSDIFILPSETAPHWKEQLGHVLIEAMGCQNALVGSDSGEVPNVIGDAGLVFPERDDAALAGALRTLITDEPLRRQLAGKAHDRFLNKYTHREIAAATRRCFEAATGAATGTA